MLQQVDEFCLDDRPYLLNDDSFSIVTEVTDDEHPHSYARVQAIWVRTLAKGMRLHYGRLWVAMNTEHQPTLEDFLRTYPGTYGGVPYASWDGSALRHRLPESGMTNAELIAHLDPVWRSHPKVPAGYSGWWVLGS